MRFASVYKNFREASDFSTIIDELAGEDADVAPKRKASDSA